jgi:lactoylglutathione lyase
MYMSYVGIRVTDLDKSLKFYTELFGLKEVARGDARDRKHGAGLYVLLRDPKSGQKLELNWYPAGSTYATPYEPGEGLDHIAFSVDNLTETYTDLRKKGVQITDVDPLATNGWIACVKDPDGNWIGLYQRPPPLDEKIHEGY